MVSVLLYASYALLGMALALLLLPTRIGVRAARCEEHDLGEAHVDWAVLAGLIGLRLRVGPDGRCLYALLGGWAARLPLLGRRRAAVSGSRRAETATRAPPAPPRTRARGAGTPMDRATGLVRLLGPPGLRFVRGCPRTVKLSMLRAHGRFGFEDPAQTGALHGCMQGLRSVCGRRVQLDVLPDFERAGLRGEVHLVVRLHLGYALCLTLLFGARVFLRWLVTRFPAVCWRPRFAQSAP